MKQSARRWFVSGLGVLFFAIAGSGCGNFARRVLIGEPVQELTFKNISYAFHVPKEISKESSRLYLLLHPAGSSGSDYIQKWIPLIGRGSDLILAPTANAEAPYGSDRFKEALTRILEDFRTKYGISKERIVLIGESNGAIFASRWVSEEPDLFTAAVLISGSIDQAVITKFQTNRERIKIRLLIVHGTEDDVFDIRVREKEAGYLKQLGLKVDFYAVKGMRHGSDVFAEEEIAKWLNKLE